MAEQTAVRSFAQAAATEEVAQPLRSVQIDGLVVLKMSKHCAECSPQLVTGLLLGLDIGSTLEVTHCFPFPSREAEEEEDDSDGAAYQLEMMRCLREVNVDNNTVGWYQSSFMGSYQTVDLIDTFLNYQENIRRCVCIVYDSDQTRRGSLALKAIKLKTVFMDLYRSQSFTSESLREKGVTWAEVFEEIPVRISNSSLVSSLMTDIESSDPAKEADFERMKLSTTPYMEQSLEMLIESMDDINTEQQKFQYFNRSVQRQQQQQGAWLQRRKAENAARKASGEELLPEEDPNNPIFKPIPEPSRIDSFLISNQIANYCTQLNLFAGPAMSKLYLMDAVQQ